MITDSQNAGLEATVLIPNFWITWASAGFISWPGEPNGNLAGPESVW